MADSFSFKDDAVLWKEFKEGNRYSFETLVRKYYQCLFNYGSKFIKDPDLIKDCLQDLFLELWKTRQNLGATPYVKSYLFKSIRNKVIRQINRNKKFVHASQSADDHYYFDVEFSIEHRLILEQTLRETSTMFAAILTELPKRQKEIIYLRFYQNLQIEEIVGILDINPQSAYNLLHKALQTLKSKVPPSKLKGM